MSFTDLILLFIALLSGLIVGTMYGFAINKFHLFPYDLIKKLVKRLKNETLYGPWSIGLYSGTEAFGLSDATAVSNPIITWQDVNDIEAEFVADPFFVLEAGKYYLFFEVLNRSTNLGDIAYATSADGIHWEYQKVILDEGFHLSYPYVFKWENEYYMIPETHEDLSVRLYKAAAFPEKWEHIGNLLEGYHFTDASIFRYDDKWWLFVSNTHNDVLNLYYSDDLLTGWLSHPSNPVMKLNQHLSRPAGRVVVDGDKVYRFAQDDFPSYGIHVYAFEVTELTETTYQEKMVMEEPFLFPTGTGWNAAGMHHIDLQKIGEQWIATVDGRDK